jgi:hypothetical protein
VEDISTNRREHSGFGGITRDDSVRGYGCCSIADGREVGRGGGVRSLGAEGDVSVV